MTEIIDPMNKPHFIQSLLNEYGLISLYIDARRENVIVPEHLKNTAQLILDIGYNLVVPIPDLTVSEQGIASTLSFNRQLFTCFIPWDSLFAVRVEEQYWGQVIMWKDNVPVGIDKVTDKASKKAVPWSNKSSHLKLIK